jgi:hypothetical protein
MPVTEDVISSLKKVLNRMAAQTRNAKDIVLAEYQPIFSFDNLDSLTADDFRSFLLFKNNRHWRGLHRKVRLITEDMNKLRNALKVLIDESKPIENPIENRLDKIRPNSGEPMVKGLGKAVITAILQTMYPEKYGIWNKITEDGLKKLKIFPEFNRGITFGEKYKLVNTVLLDLAEKLDIDLWTLDRLWWRVMKKTHTPKS